MYEKLPVKEKEVHFGSHFLRFAVQDQVVSLVEVLTGPVPGGTKQHMLRGNIIWQGGRVVSFYTAHVI